MIADHVILVGLPGAGKTAVGQRVAARLRRDFVDFDAEITRRTGMPVTAIFAAKGEAFFRQLERELTLEVAGRPPAILSPGGGWLVQPGLARVLRPPARLVHLRVSPATALRRMGPAVSKRPLLAGSDPLARIVTLWEERRASYEAADFEVDAESADLQEVTRRVVHLIERSGDTPC